VLLTYAHTLDLSRKKNLRTDDSAGVAAGSHGLSARTDQVRLGVIGAGLFANATLLPALKGEQSIKLVGVASGSGLSARAVADRFGFSYCTTDTQEILNDPCVNTVAILTRHHLHAGQVISALGAGKHIFVEKPLCLNEQELREIISAYEESLGRASGEGAEAGRPRPTPSITVGFNRRFAPFVVELKQHLGRVREPLALHCRVNGGFIPKEHWTQDPEQGGGRLRGEGCHFIDLLIHLGGRAPPLSWAGALPDAGRYSQDNLLITIEFENGSLGTISYLANGDKSSGKELLEVFGGGLSARLDDYRSLAINHAGKRVKRTARLRPDKGHRAEWQALVARLTVGQPPPIAFQEIVTSTRATLAAYRSLRENRPVSLGPGDTSPPVN
jgi:predicted dehydrogenase